MKYLLLAICMTSVLLATEELHLHIGGAFPKAYLKSIADPNDYEALEDALLSKQTSDYHALFHLFTLVQKIVDTEEKYFHGVKAILHELASDGVTYAELRTSIKDFGRGEEAQLINTLEAIRQARKETGIEARLILSVRRDTPKAQAEKTVDLALKYAPEVVALDLSGDSTKGDGSGVYQALLRGKQKGLPLTLHIGESPKEDPEKQLYEVTTLKPDRMGHAVHVSKDVEDWILTHKIPVELCLSSAVQAFMIKTPEEHPALSWLKQGHPVSICTDDPLLFETTVSKELALVAAILNIQPDTLESLLSSDRFYKDIPHAN